MCDRLRDRVELEWNDLGLVPDDYNVFSLSWSGTKSAWFVRMFRSVAGFVLAARLPTDESKQTRLALLRPTVLNSSLPPTTGSASKYSIAFTKHKARNY